MAPRTNRDACTGRADQVADFGMGEKKALGAAHAPKASLLPLLLTGRLVRLLNEVVLALLRQNGEMDSRAQLGQLSECRAALEAVGDNAL